MAKEREIRLSKQTSQLDLENTVIVDTADRVPYSLKADMCTGYWGMELCFQSECLGRIRRLKCKRRHRRVGR